MPDTDVDPRIRDLLDRCPDEALAARCLKLGQQVLDAPLGSKDRRFLRRAFQRTLLQVIRYGVRVPLSDREARVAMYLSFDVPLSTSRIAMDLRMGRQAVAGILGKLEVKGVAVRLDGSRWMRAPEHREVAA